MAAEMVDQAAGRGDNDLGITAQVIDLLANAGTAIDGNRTDMGHEGSQLFEFFDDLEDEFAGRCQDQGLGGLDRKVEVLHDRDPKGQGFTGTGRRFADDVIPVDHRQDGLGLDRSRCRDIGLGQSGEGGFGQVHGGKRVGNLHVWFPFSGRSLDARPGWCV